MGEDSKTKEPEENSTSSESSEETPGVQQPELPLTPHAPSHTPSTGLLGFLQSYPNPLTRFTTTTGSQNGIANGTSSSSNTSSSRKLPGGLVDIDATGVSHQQSTTSMYPLSTVIFVAMIAFLFGSLLRSLVSPADFIYVVSDLTEADTSAAAAVNGWREIRRLLEVKHIVGGWDFQIAVVRRH